MYCPKCGVQNVDGAQYCRGCGENISLVPQALLGSLPEKRAVGHDAEGHPYDESGRRIERKRDAPRLDKAIRSAFGGLAFLVIALILAFSTSRRADWWYWLLIPAFMMIGGGIAECVRLNQARKKKEERLTDVPLREFSVPSKVSALPPRNTAELVPPPSVTEHTTRHLDVNREPATRRINNSIENPGSEV